MPSFKKFPTPITILMCVIMLAAATTWLLPAGKYDTLTYHSGGDFELGYGEKVLHLPFTQPTLDSLHILIKLEKFANGDIKKPVSVPGSYQRLPSSKQGILDVIQAPLKGIYDTADIIFFILMIGGFIHVFYSSGAMEKALIVLSYRMKGQEAWLIIVLTFLFSLGGSSFGMAEESLVFYPVLIPLFLAAGYDLVVPVAVIHGGNTLGYLSSFSNPFSTIIASNAAGINWTDGLYGRLVVMVLTTGIFITYVVRYAQKVKKDPTASLVYRTDGIVKSPYPVIDENSEMQSLNRQTVILLLLFTATFTMLVVGVVFLDWWLLEMSVLFVVAAVAVAVVLRMGEREFIDKFIKGAESLLGVAFIIGVARGVTTILDAGNVSGSILYYASMLVSQMPPSLFIVSLLVVYMILTLVIPSSSGMAVVTMPILGSLAFVAGVPGKDIVNSYLFGMGIMGLITPTGLILPSLALANVSPKAWWEFIWPMLCILFIFCALWLVF
ncbi:YfcC family protein [Dyadobacter sp. LHD-138]|uniref:YfcC family protein n=1 Tax=Dyadobacter sp. LHD-138 TaxID=3071413 RepID=UPI0027E08CA0|nr:YfcC family protein [Dyadobacter sp. LHD-138]MDQ6477506.1 YfcC family protein [Dyadobacter sp. LHD-138]